VSGIIRYISQARTAAVTRLTLSEFSYLRRSIDQELTTWQKLFHLFGQLSYSL
jgi:hypothetical protein